MGRSVSYARGSVCIAYTTFDNTEEYKDAWDDFIEWIREQATELFPSLYNEDTWLGREDHAVLANQHCYIGVSEYCGLVSIWVVPKEDDNDNNGLAQHWCASIEKKFNNAFGTLNKIGRFSNGACVFEKRTIVSG